MKDLLDNAGYMNPTNTNSGSWSNTRRRAWCNGGFRQAVSNDLRSAFKQFRVVTGSYSGSSTSGGTNVTSQDYFALAAEKEVFGTNTWCTTKESSVLTQFTWYQTASNRVKKLGTSGDSWWERSPAYTTSTIFCNVNIDMYGDAIANANNAIATFGLAPFGCL